MLEKLKTTYTLWYGYYAIIPKTHRYTLGSRADVLFVEIIESVASASFLSVSEKQPWIRLAIRKLDTLNVLLLVLWETKSLDTKKYAALSSLLDVIGKNLGGWSGDVKRKNQVPH